MASGVYLIPFEDVLEAALTLGWDREDHQWALYNATKVGAVNYNSDSAYSSTNEIVGTGYTAKGKIVLGTAFTRPGSGVSKFSTNAVSWPASTLSGVRFVDMFAEAIAADPLMLGIDLVDPVNTSDGTLLITPHANGVATYDLTP